MIGVTKFDGANFGNTVPIADDSVCVTQFKIYYSKMR